MKLKSSEAKVTFLKGAEAFASMAGAFLAVTTGAAFAVTEGAGVLDGITGAEASLGNGNTRDLVDLLTFTDWASCLCVEDFRED